MDLMFKVEFGDSSGLQPTCQFIGIDGADLGKPII